MTTKIWQYFESLHVLESPAKIHVVFTFLGEHSMGAHLKKVGIKALKMTALSDQPTNYSFHT